MSDDKRVESMQLSVDKMVELGKGVELLRRIMNCYGSEMSSNLADEVRAYLRRRDGQSV